MLLPQFTATSTPANSFVANPAEFLRVENGCDTAVIAAMELAAGMAAEAYTGHTLRRTTFQGLFPGLCRNNQLPNPFLWVQKFPVTEVTSVEVDENGTFAAVTDAFSVLLRPRSMISFPTEPSLNADNPYPIRVTFTAGYTAATLPEAFSMGILNYIGYLYENRGDVAGDFDNNLPDTSKRLLDTLRIIPGVS